MSEKTTHVRVRIGTQLKLTALVELFKKPTAEIIESAVDELYQKSVGLLVLNGFEEIKEAI